MGILDNFKKIANYMNYTKKEKVLEQEVIRASIDDNTFYVEYSSFVDGLQEKLDYLLEDENYKTVQFTPTHITNAKYFLAAMEDPLFTSHYKIEKTVAGDFQFTLITLKDLQKDIK